jgi:hypothetical protein
MRTRLINVALLGVLCSCALSEEGARTGTARGEVDVHETSISQLAVELASGRTTSVQIVRSYLARIAAYDKSGPELNAIVRLNPEALSDAEALDRERENNGPRGPLHGIPVLVKDNYEVAGLVTSNGSLAFAGWIPSTDAFVVRRLREAGAVILGMTNMHEFARGITTISSVGGQTRNPYDPSQHWAGGAIPVGRLGIRLLTRAFLGCVQRKAYSIQRVFFLFLTHRMCRVPWLARSRI